MLVAAHFIRANAGSHFEAASHTSNLTNFSSHTKLAAMLPSPLSLLSSMCPIIVLILKN